MMDYGDADVGREVMSAVRRAIILNQHLLRRAWGTLFLALSFSMSLSIFGTPIIDSLVSIGRAGAIAMDMVGSGSALIAILWAFRRVRDSAEITQPQGDRAWSRLLGFRFLVPLWISINAIVILTIVLATPRVPLVVLLEHLGLAVYLYYALRLSFPKRIPVEDAFAVASFSLGSVASIALLSITANPAPYALIWGATIAAWVASGIYARIAPIPEFEERTGLE